MNAVFVLLPLSLLIAGIAVALFIWAVRSGQYDDLDTPPVRILFDEMPSGIELPSGSDMPAGGDPSQDQEQAAPRAATGRSQTR